MQRAGNHAHGLELRSGIADRLFVHRERLSEKFIRRFFGAYGLLAVGDLIGDLVGDLAGRDKEPKGQIGGAYAVVEGGYERMDKLIQRRELVFPVVVEVLTGFEFSSEFERRGY